MLVTRCTKCKRFADFPGAKYCGNGSDKDNEHDWQKFQISEVDFASARKANYEYWNGKPEREATVVTKALTLQELKLLYGLLVQFYSTGDWCLEGPQS